MKNLSMLIWLTQLGISAVGPPVCLIWLSVWLHENWGWGSWVLWAGTVLGIYCGIQGLMDSLRAMEKLARRNGKQDVPPPVSFNDHD